MTNRLVFLLSLLLFSSSAFAQFGQPKQEMFTIAGISVEGAVFSDPQVVISNSGLAIGDQVSIPSDKFSNAVKRLWRQRLFSDIQILEDKRIGDQIFVVIKIQEYSRMDSWSFKGLDELDEDDLKKEITLIKGQMLDPATLKRWENLIVNRYAKDGYLKTTVKFTEEPITTGKVNLIIEVDEGPDVYVKKIKFHGNTGYEDDDLISEFKETRQDSWWRIFGGPKFKKDDYEKDKGILKDFYQEQGYKDFRIIRDSVYYHPDKPRELFIDIFLYEGNKYYVRNVNWIGNKLYSDTVLTDVLGFASGDV